MSKEGALFDIAPQHETVTLRGVAVPVPGINLELILRLITRYPALAMLLGSSGKKKEVKIDPAELLTTLPEAATSIMAYGLGYVDNEDAEALLASLPFGEQLKCFEAVLTATIGSDGLAPLVARLNALSAKLGGDEGKTSRAET